MIPNYHVNRYSKCKLLALLFYLLLLEILCPPNLKKIPVNIIGELGVGKTTMINHLLTQRLSQKMVHFGQQYGLVGLDAALMRQQSNLQNIMELKSKSWPVVAFAVVRVLCSKYPWFLLQRRPDRLLIEPTGLMFSEIRYIGSTRNP